MYFITETVVFCKGFVKLPPNIDLAIDKKAGLI